MSLVRPVEFPTRSAVLIQPAVRFDLFVQLYLPADLGFAVHFTTDNRPKLIGYEDPNRFHVIVVNPFHNLLAGALEIFIHGTAVLYGCKIEIAHSGYATADWRRCKSRTAPDHARIGIQATGHLCYGARLIPRAARYPQFG